MAYYPPDYVERIALIKRLQEERFMPLRVIRDALQEDPERVRALIELEDRILERALISAEDGSRVSRAQAQERYGVPRNVLARLAEIGVLTPNQRGYDRDDVKIIEAIASFRAGGYDEALGFTVYDTLRYREALEPLVEEEVQRAARSPGGRGGGRARDGDRRRGHRTVARADRRDALEAAARGAAPPPRCDAELSGVMLGECVD